VATRLTFGTENARPAWAPDGRRFVWSSSREGPFNLYVGSVDDPGEGERLAPAPQAQVAGGWSPDGGQIVYTQEDPETGSDIWVVPTSGERRPRALVKTRFEEGPASLSPDGGWLAYASNESGRSEVYVQAFPGPHPKRQVSAGFATEPGVRGGWRVAPLLRWSRDGRELFYWDGDRLISVSVRPGAVLETEPPRVVLELTGVRTYDVAPDGRFLLVRETDSSPLTRMVVALGGATAIGGTAQ